MTKMAEKTQSYATPQLKVYGNIQQLTQKRLRTPSDGEYLEFNDGSELPLTGSCHCQQ